MIIAAGSVISVTYERLKKYCSLKRQIEDYRKEYSYLKAVDTSKPSVMNGKISDTTADYAILSIEEEQDYADICREFDELKKYIFGIEDYETREIFKLRFTKDEKYTLEMISEKVNLDTSTVQRKINKYLNSH